MPLQLQLLECSGGIRLIDLLSSTDQSEGMSGLFNLARPAPLHYDDNGWLDLTNVRE